MDVAVQRLVGAPAAAVAAVMFDPARDAQWIGGVRSAELLSPRATDLGALTRRHGAFLGRRFSWVTRVEAFTPDRELAMAFVEGPLKGEVTYRIEPQGSGSLVSIRNHAQSNFDVPGAAWFLSRSVAADLKRLAGLVEAA